MSEPEIGKVKKPEKSRFQKTVELDGITKSLTVEELDRGYLITIRKEWTDDKGGWKEETRKYASMENPLKQKEVPPVTEAMSSLFDNLELK